MTQVVMCDQFPDRAAVAHYRWDWGDEGNCCAESQQLLVQQAANLERQIIFAPLAVAEPMMDRSERTHLIAAKLAAEGEATEVAARSAKLYVQNQELRGEINQQKLLLQEASAQIARKDSEINGLVMARDRYATESGQLVNELQRANLLLEAGPSTQLEAQLAETSREYEKARARIEVLEDDAGRLGRAWVDREDELLARIATLETELSAKE